MTGFFSPETMYRYVLVKINNLFPKIYIANKFVLS